MPYTLAVHGDRVSFEATGTFSREEALQAIQDMVGHPDFRPGLDVLVDMTAVDDVPMWGADIRDKVDLDRSFLPKLGTARWAFVAPSDVVYGLARMYQALMGDTAIEGGTFRDLGAAEDWLAGR